MGKREKNKDRRKRGLENREARLVMKVVTGCHSYPQNIEGCKVNFQQRDLGQRDPSDATPVIWASECEIALHKSLLRQRYINPAILAKQGQTLLYIPRRLEHGGDAPRVRAC